MDRKLTTQIVPITRPGELPKGWNSMTFTNMGTTMITINNVPLPPNPVAGLPGTAISVGHNQFEIDETQFFIDFPNASGTTFGVGYFVGTFYSD